MAEQIDSAVEWRVIPSFPDYEASSEGQIRKRTQGKKRKYGPGYILIQGLCIGYRYCKVRSEDKGARRVRVHRLVCEAFHGPAPSEQHVVAHWNGIKTDNRPENLRWATLVENWADSRRHGTAPIGERSGHARITEADVYAIRQRVQHGQRLTQISRELGLTRNTVNHVIHCRTWAHLP
jgi:hypothetical protein